MNEMEQMENVILVDADYVDSVAFNLICNFERMLGRRIPQADMARWIDCVALDGGLRQGEQQIHVIFIHSKQRVQMENFTPSHYENDLHAKAFSDHLGEFLLSAYPIEDEVGGQAFFTDVLQTVSELKSLRHLMVIPNAEDALVYSKVRDILHRQDNEQCRTTVFAMQPMPGGNFRQEILGYSLMAALGIKGDELNPNN